MNKTLLLIICDFLLLNLLALTNWEQVKVSEQQRREKAREEARAAEGREMAGGEMLEELEKMREERERLAVELKEMKGTVGRVSVQARAALAEKEAVRKEAVKRVVRLSREVGVIEEAVVRAEEKVKALGGEVVVEKKDKEMVKETVVVLDRGTKELKVQVTELDKAAKELKELSVGSIGKQVHVRRVVLKMSGSRDGLFGRVNKAVEVPGVLAKVGERVGMIVYAGRTVFDLDASARDWSPVEAEFLVGEKKVKAERVVFSELDPRVVLVELPKGEVEKLGVEPAGVAENPFLVKEGAFVNKAGKTIRVGLTYVQGGNAWMEVDMKWTESLERKRQEEKHEDMLMNRSVDADGEADNAKEDMVSGDDEITLMQMSNRLRARRAGMLGEFSWTEKAQLQFELPEYKLRRELLPETGDVIYDKHGDVIGVMINDHYCALAGHFPEVGAIVLGEEIDPPTSKLLGALKEKLKTFPHGLRWGQKRK